MARTVVGARFSTPREGTGATNGEEEPPMDAHGKLIERVEAEQDDVLCTLQLVTDSDELSGRLFDQLVDLLVEGMFLGLRADYLNGELDRDGYVEELSALADRCRNVGLLPLPTRSL